MASRSLGTLTIDLIAKIGGFERGLDKAGRYMDKRTREIERRAKAFGKAVGVAMAAGIAAGGLAARAYIQMADEMSGLNARLRLATKSQAEFNTAQKETFRIAQTTGTSIGSVIDLYARAAQASEMLGISQAETARLTETVSKALAISGTRGAQSSAVILQLSQALASGRVQAEEFNSIIDGAPRIVQALADHFGIAFGEVKKHVTEGKVSSQDFAQALLAASQTVDEEYSSMPLTVGRATEQVRNALKLLVGDTDAATGASSGLADQISELARLLESPGIREGFNNLVSGLVKATSWAANAAAEFANFAKWLGESAARAQGFVSIDDVGGTRDRLNQVNEALKERETIMGRMAQTGRAAGFSVFSPQEDAAEFRLLSMSDEELRAEKAKLEEFARLQEQAAALANRPNFSGVSGGAIGSWEGEGNPPAAATEDPATTAMRDQTTAADALADALRQVAQEEEAMFQQSLAVLDTTNANTIAWTQLQAQLDGPLAEAELAHRDRMLEIEMAGMRAGATSEEIAAAKSKEAAAYAEATAQMREYMDAVANPQLVDAMDAARYATFNFFRDLREGEGILDSLTKALDSFADALFDIIAQQMIEGWMGKAGTTGGGNWLGNFLGGFLGGGKANGGSVERGMLYPVNERGTELLSMGGKDYLMMGAAGGRVTPNHALVGGGFNQVNHFQFAAPTDPRTQTQLAAKTGFQTQRALSRNGR